MSNKAYRKLYELKGIVDSLSDIAECQEGMDHPIVERLKKKMNEVIDELEVEG